MKRPLTEMEAFRAQELLAERATQGLDDAQAAELAALGVEDDLGFDLAAAAIDLATLRVEALPQGVADKILVAAGVPRTSGLAPSTLAGVVPARTIDTRALDPATGQPRAVATGGPLDPRRNAPPLDPRPLAIDPATARGDQPADILPIRRSRAPMVVAWVAAAACLALAVGAVIWANQQPPEIITREVPVIQFPVTPSPAEARAELLLAATDVQTLAWKATGDAAAKQASGDVVWSPSKQRGFMRFVGLAPNDPAKTQYQLWIFDKQRDAKYPVDGGVFDVGATGEVIVPISAKLAVADPVLFAVTVEAPGGVVVSKRERIVVTAAPG